ncbi:MAG: precorrin-8X methylmutase [Alphaproteobacteria bacterium]|nr:precorrin-8X methylmutase [Alphaproteobacteria bacterium]
MEYLKDPDAIYKASFAAIAEAIDLDTVPVQLQKIVTRLIHSCGMPEILPNLNWFGDPVTPAQNALQSSAPILVDATMVASGITERFLPVKNRIICTLNAPDTRDLAKKNSTTRSAAAIDLWLPNLDGAVVAIGNAPTALFRLLELLQEPSTPRPAAIFAFPVGFVGAAESKEALINAKLDIPHLTLRGRQGGSAFAAAAINAVALGDRQ